MAELFSGEWVNAVQDALVFMGFAMFLGALTLACLVGGLARVFAVVVMVMVVAVVVFGGFMLWGEWA